MQAVVNTLSLVLCLLCSSQHPGHCQQAVDAFGTLKKNNFCPLQPACLVRQRQPFGFFLSLPAVKACKLFVTKEMLLLSITIAYTGESNREAVKLSQ